MYTVTITKHETVKSTDQTYEKTSDTGNKRDGGAVYEYVAYPVEKTINTVIYTQTLDNLKTEEVIKAVNDIK